MASREASREELLEELSALKARMGELEGARRDDGLFRAMVESANDTIYTLSAEGTLLYVSPNWKTLLGHEVEEVIGKSFVSFVHPDELERCYSYRERVLASGEREGGIEYRVRHKEGHWCWHTSNGFALKAADGGTIFGGIAREVTDRKLFEEELEQKNAELARGRDLMQAIFDSAPNAMVTTNAEGRISTATHRMVDYFGVEGDAQRGATIDELVARIKDRFAEPERFAALVKRLEGSPDEDAASLVPDTIFDRALPYAGPVRRWVATFSIPIRGPGTPDTLWIFADVTKHLAADEQIHKLVEATPVPMIITRVRDGEILFANEALAALTGTNAAALRGRKTPDFYHDPTERDRIVAELGEKGKVHNHEVLLKRFDGTTFWGLLSLVVTDLGGEPAVIGGVYDIDERHRMEDKLRGALTELELANKNLKEAQTQLVQTEKMASLGMLVAGIAHEINTPVGAVNSMHNTLCRATEKLKAAMEGSQKTTRLLGTIDDANEVIHSGIERVTDIVKRLRRFARLDEAELDEVDIHEGIEDTLALIHHHLKNRVEIVKDFGSLPPINCFPRQLNQVFLNLLINASQELGEKGTITITTSAGEGFVEVRVADDGPGITPQNLGKVFDPGFTTKGVGVGTGLGLSICYRIIEDHRGEILVESECGAGATFIVRVPMDLEARLAGRV